MNVSVPCQKCGQSIEFEAEEAGRSIECPHCRQETWIYVPESRPARESRPAIAVQNAGPASPLRVFYYVCAVLLSLVVVCVGLYFVLNFIAGVKMGVEMTR